MQGFIYLYKLIHPRLLPIQILELYCLVGMFEFCKAMACCLVTVKRDDQNKCPWCHTLSSDFPCQRTE